MKKKSRSVCEQVILKRAPSVSHVKSKPWSQMWHYQVPSRYESNRLSIGFCSSQTRAVLAGTIDRTRFSSCIFWQAAPCDHEVVKRVVHWAVDLHHALRAAASRHQPAPISPWGVKSDFCSQALLSLISFSRAGAVMIDWRISLGRKKGGTGLVWLGGISTCTSFLCILDKKYRLGLWESSNKPFNDIVYRGIRGHAV